MNWYIRISQLNADLLKPVQRAPDNRNILFHYVGIELGRLHIGMTHQLLNDPAPGHWQPRFGP